MAPDKIKKEEMKACLAVATAIRKKSETGELTLPQEIMAILTEQGLLNPDEEQGRSEFGAVLIKALEDNRDLREISDREGLKHFYSSQSMNEAYAGILIKRNEDPLQLIAGIVRENSEIYPRPVPLDIFKGVPFEWTEEEILACLRKMAEEDEYQDIAQTTTSVGTVFLYSTAHLEPDYAATLAEWLDVGQANNP